MAATRKRGIITTGTGEIGILIQTLDKQSNTESAECRDGSGKITDIEAYSVGKTITISGVLDSAEGTVPEAGTVLTIGTAPGVSYLIESVSQSESSDFAKVTITAKTADSAVITPISTGA